MCQEDEDEPAQVLLDMEAGSSYFQTTDPRDEVEKILMDGLEERRTGRGSDGLVRGREYRCQTDEINRKGKGKGTGGKGEHEGKGGFGSKGIHQVTNIMTDEAERRMSRGQVRVGLATTAGKEESTKGA